jgi:hypothetical protein
MAEVTLVLTLLMRWLLLSLGVSVAPYLVYRVSGHPRPWPWSPFVIGAILAAAWWCRRGSGRSAMAVQLTFVCPHCQELVSIVAVAEPFHVRDGHGLVCAACGGMTLVRFEALPRSGAKEKPRA